MTTHEQHTVDDPREEVAAPVGNEPRIDDERNVIDDAGVDVRETAPATDDVAATAPATDDVAATAPATDDVPATTPKHESSGGEALFGGDDVVDLRARWAGVQAAFVDDPKECVQKADHLVSDVVEHLTTGFAETRSRLEGQWSQGHDASTEDLRVALMRYREFFDRLLAV